MEIDINKVISEIDFNANKYNDIGNGILLTNREIEVLNKYDIDNNQSKILQSLLKADFKNIITLLSNYYTNNLNNAITNVDNNEYENTVE